MKVYNVIGLMSGTSLDGVDISYCRFYKKENIWKYDIVNSTTIEYSNIWFKKLKYMNQCSALEISLANVEYGTLLGSLVKDFISKNNYQIDFICSHGHTIFHQPENGLTLQIGCGNKIFQINSIPVISDFRIMDVSLGGQGAPLVPIGDKLLFSEFEYCINIGGFANLSFDDENGNRVAYDICPVNIVLNKYANKLGLKYDKFGNNAKAGTVCNDLLNELNNLEYYKLQYPKSLGAEWVNDILIPIIEKYKITINDVLSTLVSHIVTMINSSIKNKKEVKILLTGGGVYNKYLIEELVCNSDNIYILPNDELINYKEAMIFAFLGILKVENEVNCLKSVTGAKRDSTCGVIYN